MKWKLRPRADGEIVAQLIKDLSTRQAFPKALAEILVQRGIETKEEAKGYFVPDTAHLHDPFLMTDMRKAVDRLVRAFQNQETLLLYGDYDVDGTTSVALMGQVMTDLGFSYEYYIPDRYKEGYGVSYQGVDYAKNQGHSLMITLDCGIKAFDKIRYANLHGIDVIICDHHNPGDNLPEAHAVLDPKRVDDTYPFKELTGCGVGIKLAQALVQEMKVQSLPLPYEEYDPLLVYGDLLALSIACDIVPIVGENRILTHLGLHKLQTDPNKGIKVLMDQDAHGRSWDISDLVFFLGPRINAAGRLEHAHAAVEVLMGKEDNLFDLAAALQSSNDARKDLDRQMTEEALMTIAESPAYQAAATTVMFQPEWHKGVIGIVASRLIESYYRPTVLLTESEGKLVGSARSVAGYDLYQALSQCDEHILQWGGHKYAAGLTIEREAFEAFKARFEEVVEQSILPEQKVPLLGIETILEFDKLDARFMRLLDRMAPFGPENRRPVFMTQQVTIQDASILKEKHVRLRVEKNGCSFQAIGFNLAQKWFSLPKGNIDIAYQPVINEWNGRRSIDLRLKDFKLSL